MSLDKNIKNCILEKLLKRGVGKTICPSEVARELYPKNWREKMEDIRKVSKILVVEVKIVITQKGEVVDPNDFEGPIRLKLKD
jgi:hypothetical protein